MKSKLIFQTVFAISFFLGFAMVSHAQEVNVDPADSLFNAKYTSFDFKSRFAALAETDALNNYYLVDFKMLPDRFERVWFMNLVFQHPEVVNIDPDIRKAKLWFQSNKRYPGKDITDLLDKLMKKTTEAAKSMTEPEKTGWLKNNDKYK
jgi:hypothetical protein